MAGHGSHLESQDSRDGDRKIKSLKPIWAVQQGPLSKRVEGGEKKINDYELPNRD